MELDKKGLKRLYKYIILGIVALILLATTGIITISKQSRVEEKVATYELTLFDYLANGTSVSQVEEFSKNETAVKSIFPTIMRANVLVKSNNSQSKITLLFSDQMDKFETGFLNEKILISGQFDEEGLMLDKTAADNLKVKVGDEVSYSVGGKTFQIKVAAIYRACSYKSFTKGLGELKWTTDLNNLYTSDQRYTLSFIEANDKDACEELLKDYIGLYGIDDFATWKAKHQNEDAYSKYLIETNEEYEKRLKKAYEEEYYAVLIELNSQYEVQDKSDYEQEAVEQTVVLTENISLVSILAAIITPIAFILIYAFFMLSERKNNQFNSAHGQSKQALLNANTIPPLIVALSVSIINALILIIFAVTHIYASNYPTIIMMFTLPTLGGTLLVYPLIRHSINKYYQSLPSYNADVFGETNLETDCSPKTAQPKHYLLSHTCLITLRKASYSIYSAIIALLIFIGILGVISTSLVTQSGNYLKYATTDNDYIIYTTSAIGSSDTFENLNGKIFVLDETGLQLNADILATVNDVTYQDNLLDFSSSLKDNEAAISQNMADTYHLTVGSTLALRSSDITYKVAVIIKAQAGFDDVYTHKGVVILNHTEALDVASSNIKQKTFTTFIKGDFMISNFDTTRKKSVVLVKNLKIAAILSIVLYLTIAIAVFGALLGLIEHFIARPKYNNLVLNILDGLPLKEAWKSIMITNVITYGTPVIFVCGLFTILKGVDLVVPCFIYSVLIIAIVMVYTYLRMNKKLHFIANPYITHVTEGV